MSRWRGWACACALAAGVVGGAETASAQCPATCPQSQKVWFSTVTKEDAVTEFVDGYGPSVFPSYDAAQGNWSYTLTPTTDLVADMAAALGAGCPVEVRFWTRGQLLRQRNAEASYSGHIYARLNGTVLGSANPAKSALPEPNGQYTEEHVFPLPGPLANGDTLTVSGSGTATAKAIGTTTGDYASAHLKMYNGGAFGGPTLLVCNP